MTVWLKVLYRLQPELDAVLTPVGIHLDRPSAMAAEMSVLLLVRASSASAQAQPTFMAAAVTVPSILPATHLDAVAHTSVDRQMRSTEPIFGLVFRTEKRYRFWDQIPVPLL